VLEAANAAVGEFNAPAGIAVGVSGDIYVADFYG